MDTKTCNTCEETKSLAEFNKDSAKKDGYRNQCKNCRSNGLKPADAKKYRRRSHDISDGMKLCSGCDERKPLDQFNKFSRSPSGYAYECKSCVSATRAPLYAMSIRLKKYGMTEEQFHQMMEKQNGLCAICDSPIGTDCHVDHCHTSLKVRGLLCKHCNLGLGHFKDSIASLHRAIQYLGD